MNAPENPLSEDFRERSHDFGGSTPPKSPPVGYRGVWVNGTRRRKAGYRGAPVNGTHGLTAAITERRFTERAEANCRKNRDKSAKYSFIPENFGEFSIFLRKGLDKIKKACYTVINVYIQFTGEDYEYHFKQQFKRADICAD